MSSGSYFTIYRKNMKKLASPNELAKTKNEYYLSSKSGLHDENKDDEELRNDIPLLMNAGFSLDFSKNDDSCKTFYDKDGIIYDKLLEFRFCSSFTCLKDKLNLNPYRLSESSALISRSEAEKMLQAVKYVLGGKYSKDVEYILSNEYVELFGRGYSLFDDRFKKVRDKIYVDKESGSYVLSFGDERLDAEVVESDDDVTYSLENLKVCLLAFLSSEDYEWCNEQLVLEYSVYG